MVSFNQKFFPGGVFLEENSTKIKNAVAEEMIYRDHITLDQSLELAFDFIMSVRMKAKTRQDPECLKYINHEEASDKPKLRNMP